VGSENSGNTRPPYLRVLAWLTGGESLHNTPRVSLEPKFSMGRFEFDPSWW